VTLVDVDVNVKRVRVQMVKVDHVW